MWTIARLDKTNVDIYIHTYACFMTIYMLHMAQSLHKERNYMHAW